MNKEIRQELCKEFTNKSKYHDKYDVARMIGCIIRFSSFEQYIRSWTQVAIDKGSRKTLTFLDMYDSTPFSKSDYDFIIWIGFVRIYSVEHSVYSGIKYRNNTKMTLNIFDTPEYQVYLSYVLYGITEDDTLFNYIEEKRNELIIAERLNTINNIIRK